MLLRRAIHPRVSDLKLVAVRLSNDDRQRVRDIAAALGVTQSAAMRVAIREASDAPRNTEARAGGSGDGRGSPHGLEVVDHDESYSPD